MSTYLHLIGEIHVDDFLTDAKVDSIKIQMLNNRFVFNLYYEKVKNIFSYISSFFKQKICDKLKNYDYKILIFEGFFNDSKKIDYFINNRGLKTTDFNKIIFLDKKGYDENVDNPNEHECEIREEEWINKLHEVFNELFIDILSCKNTGIFLVCGDYHLRDNSKLNYKHIKNNLKFSNELIITYDAMSDLLFKDYYKFTSERIIIKNKVK